jgi:hypothetical protein
VRPPQNSFTEQALRLIALPGISPFVENPGTAALTNPLSFKKLCLDAGLLLFYMNLIETKPSAKRLNPKACSYVSNGEVYADSSKIGPKRRARPAKAKFHVASFRGGIAAASSWAE